jgi:RNA polymerase sigma-70 factor (ECF subfamily)
MNRPTPDFELIDRARRGDRLALVALVARCRPVALAIARRALGNDDDAQDVAQEALVYLCQRLDAVRSTERLDGWLKKVTLSRCIDYRRRRGTRRLGTALPEWDAASEEADHAETLALHQALAHLSEDHRTTFLLQARGGWSVEEVAELLDIPVNTVRSRLASARRRLRADLFPESKEPRPMPVETPSLTERHTALIYTAFPDARILTIDPDPEAWMPYRYRIRLHVGSGERTVEIRDDIDPGRAALLPVLHGLGIPGPRLLAGPVSDGRGGFLSLCDGAAGEPLLGWVLGGTPHRLRIATERGLESLDRLECLTTSLEADPIGSTLPRRTLADERTGILSLGGPHLDDSWFMAALERVSAALAGCERPLVYTDYLHFFPNLLRIEAQTAVDRPTGWPGDPKLQENPVAEFVAPFGHFGDPLLGLAMVWIYDCYPIVHAGYVEQYLVRHDLTRRDFGPRLALQALKILQREVPVERPAGGGGNYWDALHGYVERGLSWMGA